MAIIRGVEGITSDEIEKLEQQVAAAHSGAIEALIAYYTADSDQDKMLASEQLAKCHRDALQAYRKKEGLEGNQADAQEPASKAEIADWIRLVSRPDALT